MVSNSPATLRSEKLSFMIQIIFTGSVVDPTAAPASSEASPFSLLSVPDSASPSSVYGAIIEASSLRLYPGGGEATIYFSNKAVVSR